MRIGLLERISNAVGHVARRALGIGGLRITEMRDDAENRSVFDPKLANQTTNLIVMDLDPEEFLRRLRARTEKKDK